jgi:hypothetical protein
MIDRENCFTFDIFDILIIYVEGFNVDSPQKCAQRTLDQYIGLVH